MLSGKEFSAPRRGPHPAWTSAVVGFVVIACAGVFTGMPGLLLAPLHTAFGWSRGSISVAVSVNLVLYGLTGPFAAALMDRLGMRRVVAGALVVVAIGAAGTTVLTSVWELVLCWGILVGLGTGSIAMAFGALLADRWFATRRGLVTGMLSSATMVGGMVCLPALAELTERSGWRASTFAVAGTALVATVGTVLFLRDHPADVGVAPYGEVRVRPKRDPAPGAARHAVRALGAAARSGPFWLVASTFAVCGASTNGVLMAHFVPAAADHGMSSTTASTLLAAMGICNIGGTIASGWLTDRFDARRLLAVCYALRGVSLVALPVVLGSAVGPGLVVFTVSFGLLDLATVPPTIALCREFFGRDGTIVFGWVNAAHQLGAAVAALVAGMLRDGAGTYTPVWLGVAVLCAVASGFSVSPAAQPVAARASRGRGGAGRRTCVRSVTAAGPRGMRG